MTYHRDFTQKAHVSIEHIQFGFFLVPSHQKRLERFWQDLNFKGISGKVGESWPLDDFAKRRKSAAMAGTIPSLLGIVPMNNSFEMRTDGRNDMMLVVFITTDCKMTLWGFKYLSISFLNLGNKDR